MGPDAAMRVDQDVFHYLLERHELIRREVETEWPEGYFTDVIGGWVGEPLERAPQGDFEAREEFQTGRMNHVPA